MTTTISITHALDADDCVHENTRGEILEFILDLSNAVEEPVFTKQIILRLAETIREEVSNAEMQELAKSISEIGGDL